MLHNNIYVVRKLRTNKTQLLHQIRLEKFTPQASIADILVHEAGWQKDERMRVAHDDLFAQLRNTNIGPNPLEDGPHEYTQNTDDFEYIPIEQPEKTPPSTSNFRKDSWSLVGRTIVPENRNVNEITQETYDDETDFSQKTQNDVDKASEEKTKQPGKTLRTPHCNNS